jgi:glycosyltransferase involved in cell wall biosynthesis
MKKELTVIIPFLNENKEVLNTVKNLRENSDQEFDIILINDCSTDGYDYKKVAEDYGALYVEHSQRTGVAASRDEAVGLCNTDYFLLLDAHMRVYQRNWVDIFVAELKKNPKDLLCALTLDLDFDGKPKTKKLGYGAYFEFRDLSIKWLHKEDIPSHKEGTLIPCVLGASYACSKKYWQYLDGLNGLKSYGLDEQLISIKVWLDGGRCRLIRSIKFGHIFRTGETVPYELRPKDFCRNILLIAELFYGFEMKVQLLQNFRAHRDVDFVSVVIEELAEEKEYILSRKRHYMSNFPNSISHIVAFNNQFLERNQTTN